MDLQTPTFHPWKRLPQELKFMVLRHRLLLPGLITVINHPSHSARSLLKLILTNKATKAMALDVYYGENMFCFMRRNSPDYCRPDKLHWEWKLPNPAFLIRVRNIEVVTKASVDTGFKMAWDDRFRTEWPYLFLDERKPATAPASNWQKHFTNVTQLKIVVEFAPHPTLTCLDSCLASCVKEMRGVRVRIMPRKVEIESEAYTVLKYPNVMVFVKRQLRLQFAKLWRLEAKAPKMHLKLLPRSQNCMSMIKLGQL
ncbi:hypothetical protein HBH64_198690 [Parastagonospora nodorum]|nr:hypothetical protein HBI10_162660 [Parastagonospora nodorum]KAH4019606.1 hypothetical protein HBI13_127020 [Parastagonospora nodorum]KAH4019634.1 hypothetical protein HBI09_183690 [Parastagonospora nodorum]KAH4181257.1 hypothetical protein HBH42_238900 [Parastagonospora nodorum]KAH4193030.1 hypothetical protein HBI95_208150 [Parastagonospora nodorum]